jgi:hypothetical protein
MAKYGRHKYEPIYDSQNSTGINKSLFPMAMLDRRKLNLFMTAAS